MSFRDEVLKRLHLESDEERAKQIFAAHNLDFDALVDELNSKAEELEIGNLLRRGVLNAIQNIVGAEKIDTPAGSIRLYNYDSFAQQGQKEVEQDLEIVRAATKQLYADNAKRVPNGRITALLDRTVSQAEMLMESYFRRADAFTKRGEAIKWIVTEARNRGLSDNEPLRKAFDEGQLERLLKEKEVALAV